MKTPYYAPHANDLIALRLTSCLTQQKVSEILHVTLKTVQNWEKGRSSIPYSAFKLLKVLGRYELPNDEWQDWTVNKGKLFSPLGRSFMPHELIYISNYFAMARFWIADREKLRDYIKANAIQSEPKLRLVQGRR